MRSGMRRTTVAVLVGVALLGAACSSDDGEDATTGGTAAPATDEQPTGTGPDTGSTDEEGAIPTRFVGATSDTYGAAENWICSPLAADDPCDRDLTTTVVQADGSTEVVDVTAAEDAPVDCFYVYPTVNIGTGGPADELMAADITAETAVVGAQLARFGSVCRIWAPLYRQLTLDGFGAENSDELRQRAYDDVHEAFAHYMSEGNDGRPFVLMGHSQGSFVLSELLAEEFDGDAELTDQLLSAMLIGGRSTTAADGSTGGSFASLPACTSPDETGCVIGYNSVTPGAGDELVANWGGAPEGERRLCTNPASLGGGAAPLQTIIETDDSATGLLATDTPYLQLDGALVGECVERGEGYVFEVTVADGWPAAELERLSTNVDFWGLHIVDVNLAEGDLVDLVASQTAAHGG